MSIFDNIRQWFGPRQEKRVPRSFSFLPLWEGRPAFSLVDLKTYIEAGFNVNSLVHSALESGDRPKPQPINGSPGFGNFGMAMSCGRIGSASSWLAPSGV